MNRLSRSTNRMLAGVCAGIAEFLGWHPAAIRALFALGTLISGVVPGVIIYCLLWWMMPLPPDTRTFRLDDFREQ